MLVEKTVMIRKLKQVFMTLHPYTPCNLLTWFNKIKKLDNKLNKKVLEAATKNNMNNILRKSVAVIDLRTLI
jgi:hypothetical protein